MSIDLDKLDRITQDAQGWANTSEAWANTDDFEDEDPGVQLPTWIVGAVDEGVYFDVAVVDCEQYGTPGESEKLAKFYAAANPAIVLELVRRLREAEESNAALTAACQDACSVISSINSGTANRVKIGSEPVYWQREEWVRWALDEVLPKTRAVLGAEGCAEAIRNRGQHMKSGD